MTTTDTTTFRTGEAAAGGPRWNPSSWAILATIVVLSAWGGLAFWGATTFPRAVAGPVWTVIAALVWLVYGLVLVGLVVRMQRYNRRPALLVLLALAWGGLASLGIAGHANSAIQGIMANLDLDQSAWVWAAAPAVEETVKALGIILLILLPVLVRIRPLDGLFVGAVVGASFQVVENFSFTLEAIETQADSPGSAVATMLLLRGVFGIFSHVVFSALIGAAIGWVAAGGRDGRALRIVLAALAGVSVITLHAVSNWTATEGLIMPHLLLSVAGLVALLLVLRSTRRTEAKHLADWASSAGAGMLAPEDQAALAAEPSDRTERRARRQALRAAAAAEVDYLKVR